MLRIHPSAAVLLVAGLAVSIAQAQVNKIAWTTDDDDDFGFLPTDAGVGVNDQAVVTTGNMHLALFDRSGTELDSRQVGDTDWPFLRIDTFVGTGANDLPSRYFDPQVEYHTQSGRLWMLYSEMNAQRPPLVFGTGDNNISALHIAISKEMVGTDALDSLDYDDWHYFTGDGTTNVGQAGDYFNLQDDGMIRYREPLDPEILVHEPYPDGTTFFDGSLVDKPNISIDEQAAYIVSFGSIGSTLLIIPTSHGTGQSILDGEKPPASTWTFMRFQDLADDIDEDTGALDDHEYHYAVQEPFEDEDFLNAQFIISQGDDGEGNNVVRLGGLWYDSANGQWQYTQRVNPSSPTELLDLAPPTGFEYENFGTWAQSPSSTWGISGTESGPGVALTLFSSAVLVKDAHGDPRIFAACHVHPIVGGVASDQFVVQWYVIDPKLDTLRSSTAGAWQPTIEAIGRLGGGQDTADRYHPVIGVTQQGVAYIEYTYSSNTVWPQVRRATLNSSYTGIVPNSETTMRTGPSYSYAGDAWADFAEMQADPVTGCAFWSVHTLAHDPGETIYPNDERDVWLFQTLHNCQNSNLNFDDGVDMLDMALFNDYYSVGARRVDMNIDGQTDATDATLFQNAYQEATGP